MKGSNLPKVSLNIYWRNMVGSTDIYSGKIQCCLCGSCAWTNKNVCRLKQHTVQGHCTWCHIPKTGIVGIPLTLNLGEWIQVSAEHAAGESPQCPVEKRLDRSRACLDIPFKRRPCITVLNQTPANQHVTLLIEPFELMSKKNIEVNVIFFIFKQHSKRTVCWH